MMNYLWGGMLLLGVIYGAFAGTLDGVTEAIINSAKEAVNLVIAIAGITALDRYYENRRADGAGGKAGKENPAASSIPLSGIKESGESQLLYFIEFSF